MLQAGKEEQLVFLDGAAEPEASLLPAEVGTGRLARLVRQGRKGRHVVIAIEEKPAAMEVVATRARDDIDGPARSYARRKVEIGGGKLEFLYYFLREVLLRAAGDAVLYGGAVHGDAHRVV